MRYFAELDLANNVTRVIVADELQWIIDNLNGTWIETSINADFRYNYAGIGHTYDPVDDAFIGPMPECGHDELLLNDLKRWECATCDDEFKQRMASVEE